MRHVVVVAFLMLLVLALAAPAAFAHNAGPCNDSGEPGNSDYARHHIVPADLGNDGHKPGGHNGFSVCLPQVGWKK